MSTLTQTPPRSSTPLSDGGPKRSRNRWHIWTGCGVSLAIHRETRLQRSRADCGALQCDSEVFNDFHYTEEIFGENTGFLVARAQVDGQDIEMVDYLRLGPDGKI